MMFLACVTGVLWSLSCSLSIIFVVVAEGVEGTGENMKFIAFGVLFYIVVLQTFNILMLRFFSWARWAVVGFSVFSIVLMIFAMINFTGLNAVVHYMAFANLIAAVWSCFYYSSSLWVKFIRKQAAKYQAVHGYDPIQWRKDNPRRLF
ncbi:hypothetical protein MSP8887_01548 [Marinomonas spartinae]|uniref:hypothetical protein n=1 Tax=Marinomonas spartinae TaxID=1792290 RepID=UPI000808DA21|nr:hypothetical protein [Marinomonas spartinae]SBS31582.1 hypothetical protein MSP8887_01548 [Marinomonas spartinae]